MTRFLILFLLIMPIQLMADEVTVVDTTRAETNDSTITHFLPGDKTTHSEVKNTVPLPLLSNTNNLLSLLDAMKSGDADNYDHVNMMARLDYDSRLMRVYSSPWGEFETIYPYGFSPSMLSRSDDLFSNHSFANPMPLPGSEEFIRMEHSDSYYLLTPSVSHLINPFGRMFTIHQPSDWYRSDSTIANVYARFGRAGLSNTYFNFNRPVDVLGHFRFDGTFSKFDGYALSSRSETDRLRIMFEPEIHPCLVSDVTLFFDRTKGSKTFFPKFYEYSGEVSDNYSGAAFRTQYVSSKSTNYKAKLSYQKNSQRINQVRLFHDQTFKVYNLDLSAIHQKHKHLLELKLTGQHLNYQIIDDMTRSAYYNISVTDYWKANNQLTIFSSFAVLGSSDLKPMPTFTLLGQYQLNENVNTTSIASVRYVMPAPEMLYLPETGKALQSGDGDYLINGDDNLESGRLVSIENYLTIKEEKYYLKMGSGFMQFKSLPDWIADFNQLQYGSYQAVGLDRNFIFFSSEGMLSLPYNFHLSAAHTYRHIFKNKINYTYGAEHNLTGFSGTSFIIPKVDILMDASAGLKYRSVTNKYFASAGDNSVLMFEVFLTFNLKAFHFFWNYNNVLSKKYYINGILQPGRSIWWGFRWRFMN